MTKILSPLLVAAVFLIGFTIPAALNLDETGTVEAANRARPIPTYIWVCPRAIPGHQVCWKRYI